MSRELRLAVKKEYFDQIKAGTKVQEFRLYNDYWRKRIEGKRFDELVITLGYPKKDDTDRIMRFPWRGYKVTSLQHPEFGDKPVDVFAIILTP